MFYIDIHTHSQKKDNKKVVEFVNYRFPVLHANFNTVHTIGIHPWDIELIAEEEELIQELKVLLNNKYCVGIGECGLDFFKKTIDEKKQIHFFSKQIELSEALELPLIIHCVRAFHELFYLHKLYKPKQAWIVHGFNGSLKLATQLLEKGIYMSFGKTLLLSHSQKLIEIIPLNQLFFETDESDILIASLYKQAALYYNVNESVVIEQIWKNLTKCFAKWNVNLV